MTKSRVIFPARHGTLDFSKADEYGAVLFATGTDVTPYRTEEFIDAVVDYFDEIDFDATTDYIGLSGSTTGVSLLLACAVANYGRVRVLLFEQRNARYVMREVSIPE